MYIIIYYFEYGECRGVFLVSNGNILIQVMTSYIISFESRNKCNHLLNAARIPCNTNALILMQFTDKVLKSLFGSTIVHGTPA
jgi:hypothetical protein